MILLSLYLYRNRLPLKNRLLLDTVLTWLDFSNLKQHQEHCERPAVLAQHGEHRQRGQGTSAGPWSGTRTGLTLPGDRNRAMEKHQG